MVFRSFRHNLLCFLMTLGLLGCAVSAQAGIFAEAELGYTWYSAKINEQDHGASTFQHRYTLLYTNNGLLDSGRLGSYRYSLGYEWASFDSRIHGSDDVSLSQNTGHLLYNAEVDFRPRRLPLRIKAYSRDLSRLGFLDTVANELQGAGTSIIDPHITGSITNGTHIKSGVLVTVGLQNEVNAPFYRELPRLVIDYSDNLDRDTKGISQTNSHRNRLGIMLTKGDVELSYWRQEFNDMLNKVGETTETYTVGTVGYQQGRRWMDLTNWIRVSADASHSHTTSLGGTIPSNEYSVNLLGVANRDKWEMNSLNSFSRETDVKGTTTRIKIPLNMKGRWNADTDWTLRAFATKVETKGSQVEFDSSNTDLLASLQVNMLKHATFAVSPSFSVEHVDNLGSVNDTIVASIDATSTRRFSDRHGLAGSYSIAISSSESGGNSSVFVQHVVSGRGVYVVNDRLRLELDNKFLYGTGTNETNSGALTTNFDQILNAPGTIAERRDRAESGFWENTTKLKVAWLPAPRMNVGVAITQDVLKRSDQGLDLLNTVSSTVNYVLPNFSVGSNVRFSKRVADGNDSTELSGSSNVKYTPDKKMSTELNATFSRTVVNEMVSNTVDLIQRSRYSFFSTAGFGRKWLDLSQELSWSQTRTTSSLTSDLYDSKKRLTFGADYFFSRNLFFSATIRYSLLQTQFDPEQIGELYGSGGVGLRFPKLQANLEYSYGQRDGKTDNRVEQRVSANVRKQF